MLPLIDLMHKFLGLVAEGTVEIYNEFSLQHEAGVFLRPAVPTEFKVQFERPVDYFCLQRTSFVKKEIDIVIFQPVTGERYAIEFNFPRNGQYPEQMFKATQDIAFLEQLVAAGFAGGLFVMVADDPLFYSGRDQTGVYEFFRAGHPLRGLITKPTGKRDETVAIHGSYVLSWRTVAREMKYVLVFIQSLNHAATVAEQPAQSLPLHAGHPPLRVDEGGVVRVGKSRINLDLIVEQYENGMTPEDMVRAYDTLVLAEVHAVIAYYLRHRDEVWAYLKQRAKEAETLRTKIEAERPRVSREEFLARRGAREKTNAPNGQ